MWTRECYQPKPLAHAELGDQPGDLRSALQIVLRAGGNIVSYRHAKMKNTGAIEACPKAGSVCDNGTELAKVFLGNLTAAERRILASVSLAKTNKEIAAELDISPATVKRHLENILRKLHLRNRVAAAVSGFLAFNCRDDENPACALKKCLSNCAGHSTPAAPADS